MRCKFFATGIRLVSVFVRTLTMMPSQFFCVGDNNTRLDLFKCFPIFGDIICVTQPDNFCQIVHE